MPRFTRLTWSLWISAAGAQATCALVQPRPGRLSGTIRFQIQLAALLKARIIASHSSPEVGQTPTLHALQIPVAVPRPPISPGDLKRLNVVAPGGSPYLSTSALSLSSDWRTGPPAPDGPTYLHHVNTNFPATVNTV